MTGQGNPNELARICTLVATRSGQALGPESTGSPQTVEEFAAASGLSFRKIRLKGEWFRHDCGPMVAFAGHRPAALIPAGDGYKIYLSGQSGKRVKAKEADCLNASAFQFLPTLPKTKARVRDLLRIAWQGRGPDLGLALCLGLVTGLLGMAPALLAGLLFNRIIPGGHQGLMLQLALGVMAAAVAGSLFSLVQGFCLQRFSSRSAFSLQAAVWARLVTLPLSFFNTHEAGDLNDRAMAAEHIRTLFSQRILSAVLALTVGLFNFLAALYYAPSLTLAVVIFALVATAIGAWFSLIQLRFQRKILALSGKLEGWVLQMVSAMAKLRAAGVETRAFHQWQSLFVRLQQLAYRSGLFSMVSGLIFTLLPMVQAIVIFYLIFRMDPAHRISPGSFMAFSAAAAQFTAALGALSGLALIYVQAKPLVERVSPILETCPEPGPDKGSSQRSIGTIPDFKGNIEVLGVDFSYPDGPKVLKNIKLYAAPGEFVAIAGPSGSGKSTLLKIILGLSLPDTGLVRYDGRKINDLDLQPMRQKFGVVLQENAIIQGTIRSNVCGPRDLPDHAVLQALEAAGLMADVQAMPMGIRTILPHGGGGLSGGQQQRLMIARALAGSPSILIFDEATSALDGPRQRQVADNLATLNLTRIVVAHRLSTIRQAHRIYVMDEGRIKGCGTFNTLLEKGMLSAEASITSVN